jgi:AcrR family transcriptional regulator
MRAAVDELLEHGYAGAKLERVAARAGIAKTTIYRRWGSLEGLLADLMADRSARDVPVPDTGGLDTDLRAMARDAFGTLGESVTRAAFTSVVAAALQDPAARDLLRGFIGGRLAMMKVIIERAVRRGELPAGTDTAGVLQVITAQIFYWLVILGEPASEARADRAAATAAAAARAGALTDG